MLRIILEPYYVVKRQILAYRARRRIPFTEYLLRYFMMYKMTASGRAVVLTMFMVNLMAWYNISIPIYQLVLCLFMLLGGAMLYGWLRVADIQLQGGIPEKVTAGTPARARYHLVNKGQYAARDLGARFFWLPLGRQQGKVGLSVSGHTIEASERYTGGAFLDNVITSEETLVESLAPGQETSLSLDLMFNHRGIYKLPRLRVYTQFPFNLFRTPVRLDADSETRGRDTVIVLPNFVPAEGIEIPASRNYQPGGISLTSDVGESPEYIGSREYRSGDNVRRIDFRGWARRGEPVVREYQEEYYCRVAVIMDTYIGKGQSDEVLEGAIQLTAAIADALSDGEYIIDLFAAGPDLYVFRSGRHTAHFDNILEILACLESSQANPFDEIGPALRDEVANISTAIFVFMDWDDTRERLVRTALESGCSVKIYFVSQGVTTLPTAGAESMTHSVRSFTPEEVQRGAYGVL